MFKDRKISASFLKRWGDCPQQGYYRYVEGLPDDLSSGKQVFGTVMHKVLEETRELTTLEVAVNLFDKYWSDPGLLGEKIDYWHPTHSEPSLRKKGHESLGYIWDMNSIKDSDSREILAREHKFLVPFGPYMLTGYVDLVEIAPGKKIKITDYKSAGRKPTKAELAFDLQFTLYDYASRHPLFWLGNEEDYEEYPPITGNKAWVKDVCTNWDRQLNWFHLMTGKEITCPKREAEDYKRMMLLIEQIERAVEANAQVPNIGPKSCGFCAYTDICQAVTDYPNVIEELKIPTTPVEVLELPFLS